MVGGRVAFLVAGLWEGVRGIIEKCPDSTSADCASLAWLKSCPHLKYARMYTTYLTWFLMFLCRRRWNNCWKYQRSYTKTESCSGLKQIVDRSEAKRADLAEAEKNLATPGGVPGCKQQELHPSGRITRTT